MNIKQSLALAVGSAVIALGGMPASAALVSTGGGNIDSVPLYRALAYTTIDFDDAHIFGTDFVSNVAPLPVLNTVNTITKRGAALQGVGQSTYSGFYAGRNYARITVTNAQADARYYQQSGFGTATSVRFFTEEARAARARFTFHVSGTDSAHASGIGGQNTGRLDFGASTNPDAHWLNLFSDPTNVLESITEFGVGTFTYDLPIADLGETINLFYWASAFASVGPGDVPQGSNFTLTADYSNTIVLESVELMDETGTTPIDNWSLEDMTMSETVFDQTGRLAAITPPAMIPDPDPLPVPAPAGLGLIGLGLMLMSRFKRRA